MNVDGSAAAERLTFAGWLAGHAAGRTNDECSVGFIDLVEMCQLHDKPGRLVLTVTVTPQGDGFVVSAQTDARPPKVAPVRPGQFYFRGDDGMPSRRDPNQPELPFPGLSTVKGSDDE